jgi:hypothetical protein
VGTQTAERDDDVGLLPPFESEEKKINRSLYMPEKKWDRLAEIAEETKRLDPKGKGFSRNDLIEHALTKFIEDWEREHGGKKKK